MLLKLQKIGNSQGVVLPKPLLAELGFQVGVSVEARIVAGELVISPTEPRYTLEELCAKLRPEHAEPETDWGHAVGAEVLPDDEPC